MTQHWIDIEGELISLEDTPILLKNLNLMPIFLRRYFESKFTRVVFPAPEGEDKIIIIPSLSEGIKN